MPIPPAKDLAPFASTEDFHEARKPPPSSKDFMHSLAEIVPLRQATQINIL